jgi:hypothetical protein
VATEDAGEGVGGETVAAGTGDAVGAGDGLAVGAAGDTDGIGLAITLGDAVAAAEQPAALIATSATNAAHRPIGR